MKLSITLESLVTRPAVTASDAMPDAPITLTFLPTVDPHRLSVQSVVSGGPPRVTTYTKIEAMAIGNAFLEWAKGTYDLP